MSGWHTKRDVIRDLTKVTNGIADIDIDDSYIVIGNEKPKRRIEDEFYDEDPRFEGADLNHESGRAPDLDGIKQMLQMCREHEEMEERARGVGAGCGDGVPYVISKLNPLTAPFEPRGGAAGGAEHLASGDERLAGGAERLAGGAERLAGGAERLAGGAERLAGGAERLAGGAERLAGGAELLAGEREIRHVIDQASLDTSRKGRTLRNVAVASLLKLHSRGSPGPRPSPADSGERTPPRDESVQHSIEEVSSWLSADPPAAASPPPPAPAAPPAGESMFRKKRPAKSAASAESGATKRQPVTVGRAYKPSDYAENLRSRYIENNKPKPQPNENVWEKLERELKERDERIMKERLNAERRSRSGSEHAAA